MVELADRLVHPSYLTLDRVALGVSASSDVREHISDCAVCAAYLAQVNASAVAIPAWARQLSQPRTHRWRMGIGISIGSIICASAAAVLLWTDQRPLSNATDDQYIGAKGGAAVGIYIHRNGVVRLWDGQAAIAENDELRLKILADRYRYVQVWAQALLYEGTLPVGRESMLPTAWRVDGQRRPEILKVILSDAPVDHNTALQWIKANKAPRTIWMQRYHLPKK